MLSTEHVMWLEGLRKKQRDHTFCSPQILLTVCFPLREQASSITSSCTRLAVWIISAIKAMERWLACTSLVNRKQCFLRDAVYNLLSNHLVKTGHQI